MIKKKIIQFIPNLTTIPRYPILDHYIKNN